MKEPEPPSICGVIAVAIVFFCIGYLIGHVHGERKGLSECKWYREKYEEIGKACAEIYTNKLQMLELKQWSAIETMRLREVEETRDLSAQHRCKGPFRP